MPVGLPVPRKDSLEKVKGGARYVDDIVPKDCWFGATVRSSIPYGTIKDIRFPKGIDWESLVIARAEDIPGRNLVALIAEDQPLLADGVVRHVGEPILLLAGPDKERVQKAARAVEIEYEAKEAITDLRTALDKGSAPGCETSKNLRIHRGDIKKGFQDADMIVEGSYWVGHQEQLYIETNGFIAWWEEDGQVVVQGSQQCPYYVHKSVKVAFGLPDDKVRVIATTTGGGFGGKEDFPSVLASHAALLAKKAGRPVKMIYSRQEDFTSTTKRHPGRLHYRTGVKKDGSFTACTVRVHLDCGAYITLSSVVLSRGVIHSCGPYYWPAVDVLGVPVATHTAPNGAFRGFGAPQVYFGLERHIDRIAEALDMDPVELRRNNLLREGGITATGQVLKESVSALEVLDAAVESSDYQRRIQEAAESNEGPKKGVGISLYMHGTGFTGSGEARMSTVVRMKLHPDGHVEILTGSTDMGQGTETIFCQIAAKKLGISYDKLFLAPPDTAIVPDSGPTVASRTTTIVGSVVAKLAGSLRDRILEFSAKTYGGEPSSYRLRGERLLRGAPPEKICDLESLATRMLEECGPITLESRFELASDIHWDDESYSGEAYPAFSYGCVVAEVEVDPDTLEVQVNHLTAIHDIGTLIHPVLAEGQVEGGIVQALGYGLMEEVVWKDGVMLNPSFTNYVIPTALDVPELDVGFIQNPYSGGPFGAKGVGELPMNGPAPAIASAVSRAMGVNINEIPATPERILAAMGRAEAGGAE